MKQLIIFSISICCFCLGCNKNAENISIQNTLHNNLDGYYDGKKLSASMQRYLEQWGQTEPSQNEFYTSFSYYPLKGLEYEEGVSPSTSKIILKVYLAPPSTSSIFINETLPLNFDSAGVALGNLTFSKP